MSKIVIGNWKMNGLKNAATVFRNIVSGYSTERSTKARLALCPPATLLAAFAKIVAETAETPKTRKAKILLGGQYCHHASAGSFTGGISAAMLKDAGASLTLVGHAERRAQGEDQGEDLEQIKAQLLEALKVDLTPVLCVGEREAERPQRQEHLARQLTHALAALLPSLLPSLAPPLAHHPSELIVAYEPVWAIGSGTMPSSEDIAAVCGSIAEQAAHLVPTSTRIKVLYGGSVTPDNAAEILAITDGVLVGSASLDAEKLLAIVDAA